MVELEYVKKRKRRKAAGIITGIASMGLAVLILVSFLGQRTGSFTVSLNTGNVKLSLSEKSQFEQPSSFLKVDSVAPYGLYTYDRLPEPSELDNENHDYLFGAQRDSKTAEVIRMEFFKYTFFIKNGGSISAHYDMKIEITENKPGNNGVYLDSFVRVMVFENNANSEVIGEPTIYAMASEGENVKEDGTVTNQEYISKSIEQAKKAHSEFPGFATNFESNSLIATIPVNYFDKYQIKRYTIVTWLEGYDPQCLGEAPEGANLKLGVSINAYENKQ